MDDNRRLASATSGCGSVSMGGSTARPWTARRCATTGAAPARKLLLPIGLARTAEARGGASFRCFARPFCWRRGPPLGVARHETLATIMRSTCSTLLYRM